MPRKITIDPVTRIEGHARVDLEVDDSGQISAACFNVIDFRGFETFLQGMQVEMMPTITARICGTCPHTHHLAAAKAIDKVFGVTIPQTAVNLRNLLNLGSIVHSHAIHLFVLAGPDLLLGLNSDPVKRNVVGLIEKYPDIAKKALRLRTIGQKICEYVGGRGTHPVSMVAGGVAAPLTKEKLSFLQQIIAEGLHLGKELYIVVKKVLFEDPELLQSLPLETAYLGTVNNNMLDLYEGDLRLRTLDNQHFDFSADDWTSHIVEEAISGSYGKISYCKTTGEERIPYRVGPLARLNCVDQIDTPLANKELEQYRSVGGNPCHQTVMYHYARMIELLYALEKLSHYITSEDLVSTDIRAKLGSPRNAAAHVEAPRGLLIHDYKVDENAIVTEANLLVATQQNISAINETVKLSAQKYINQKDDELLNSIEFGIRCYDPCLSCATHRIGQMKLNVVIREQGTIIRQIRR